MLFPGESRIFGTNLISILYYKEEREGGSERKGRGNKPDGRD